MTAILRPLGLRVPGLSGQQSSSGAGTCTLDLAVAASSATASAELAVPPWH
jgi:hypothetical protein